MVFIGKAQEKTPVFRTERRRNEKTGVSYPWLVRSTAMVNHFYVYVVDRDFGPFFLKFCTYFPYNAKLCLNGHEYVKRQLEQKRIGYQALDNGILSCDDTQACAGRSVMDYPRRRSMPCCASGCDDCRIHSPPPDRQAGYRYRPLYSTGGVFPHPGVGSTTHRPHFLRRSHPRKSGHRQAQSGAVDFQPPSDAAARPAGFARG